MRATSQRMRLIESRLRRRIRNVMLLTATRACERARALSAVQYFTPPQLARMGHPYSARHPRPPIPPYIVSRQSGEFYGGWQVESYGEGFRVVNTSQRADLLLRGTSRMIARPVLDYIYDATLEDLREGGREALYNVIHQF